MKNLIEKLKKGIRNYQMLLKSVDRESGYDFTASVKSKTQIIYKRKSLESRPKVQFAY